MYINLLNQLQKVDDRFGLYQPTVSLWQIYFVSSLKKTEASTMKLSSIKNRDLINLIVVHCCSTTPIDFKHD